MKRFLCVLICIAYVLTILAPKASVSALTYEATQLIAVTGGQPAGSNSMSFAEGFDMQPAVDSATGIPSGGTGTTRVPNKPEKTGYIDFGADFANIEITGIWTQYTAYTSGSMPSFATLWWDDDIDNTINETGTDMG